MPLHVYSMPRILEHAKLTTAKGTLMGVSPLASLPHHTITPTTSTTPGLCHTKCGLLFIMLNITNVTTTKHIKHKTIVLHITETAEWGLSSK